MSSILGRPPRAVQASTARAVVPLTPRELDVYQRAARARGYSLAEWVRLLVRRGLTPLERGELAGRGTVAR